MLQPSSRTSVNDLLRSPRTVHNPTLRLLCLPYAGGGASVYYSWGASMPERVEVLTVQLPARQERLHEPPWTHFETIVDEVFSRVSALGSAPLAIYGHSFGAILGFELARRLRRANHQIPALIVGARKAPHLPSSLPPIHKLGTEALLEQLHQRYGTSWSLLRNQDVMDLALPSLRADLTAIENYAYVDGPLLDVPLISLHGKRDPLVSTDEMAAWASVTSNRASLHEVDAGHFFVDTERAWVIARVRQELQL